MLSTYFSFKDEWIQERNCHLHWQSHVGPNMSFISQYDLMNYSLDGQHYAPTYIPQLEWRVRKTYFLSSVGDN